MEIKTFQGAARILSNFWPVSVVYEGHVYPSVENAYQAAKTLDPSLRLPFETYTSSQAKKASHKLSIRPDWSDIKLEVMEGLLLQKFTPGSEFADFLDKTKDFTLTEGNSWHDNFWGNCTCGKKPACAAPGMNHLGNLLMKIRKQNRTP